MRKTGRKVFEWIIDILIILFFVVAIFVGIGAFNKTKTGVNSVFGYVFNTVLSDSMTGTMEDGDLIVGKLYDGQTLKEGDIITFWQVANGQKVLNTHRIVEVQEYSNGETVYKTKGDKAGLPVDNGARTEADIVAVYSFRIPGLGNVLEFIRQPAVFVTLIVIPLLASIAYQIYKIVSAILKLRDEKRLEQQTDEPSDEVKQAIIQEYLRKQQTEATEPPGPEAPSAP